MPIGTYGVARYGDPYESFCLLDPCISVCSILRIGKAKKGKKHGLKYIQDDARMGGIMRGKNKVKSIIQQLVKTSQCLGMVSRFAKVFSNRL